MRVEGADLEERPAGAAWAATSRYPASAGGSEGEPPAGPPEGAPPPPPRLLEGAPGRGGAGETCAARGVTRSSLITARQSAVGPR